MKLINILLGMMVVAALGGCSNSTAKSARDTGDNGGAGGGKQEVKPTPGSVVEKIIALQFQKPTLTESEFLNSLDIDFGTADRAYFSFSYAPDEDGTFYFTMAQVRLSLRECTKDPHRGYKMEIYWQVVDGGKRTVVKQFTPNIDDFQFQKGKTYILTYAMMDLKTDFADCKGGTLKFATFKKNY